MQSLLFYDDEKFGAAFVAVIGDAIPHTAPPTYDMQGTVLLSTINVKLIWAVDPEHTKMHLLFLSTVHNGEPFACQRWVVSFPNEALGCGVSVAEPCKLDAATGSLGQTIRIVWVSPQLSLDILSFDVSREQDALTSIRVVQSEADPPKRTGSLSAIQRGLDTHDMSRWQASVIQAVDDAQEDEGVFAAAVFCDGNSLWTAIVRRDGVDERCLIGGRTDTSLEDNSQNRSQSAWGLLRNAWPASSPTSSLNDSQNMISRSSPAKRTILGISSLAQSEGFLVVYANGQLGHFPSTHAVTKQSLCLQSLCMLFEDDVPTSSVHISTYARRVHKDVQTSEDGDVQRLDYDVVTVGQVSEHSFETVWWHRFSTVTSAVSVTKATLVASLTAPVASSFVHTLCCDGKSLAAFWQHLTNAAKSGVDDTETTSVNIVSLLSHTNRPPAHAPQEHLVQVARLSDLDDASCCCIEEYVGSGSAPHQVVSSESERQERWIALQYQDGCATAAVLFKTPPQGRWLSKAIHSVPRVALTMGSGAGTRQGAIPFAPQMGYCSLIRNGETIAKRPSRISDSEEGIMEEGIRILDSHVEGMQTFVNLLQDAVLPTNAGIATTLGGFHELAAAARIYRHTAIRSMDVEPLLKVIRHLYGPSTWLIGSSEFSISDGDVQFQSRLFVQQVAGSELLLRASSLLLAYLAWVTHADHSHEKHHAVQRSMQQHVETLLAALNAAQVAGSLLPMIVAESVEESDDVSRAIVAALLGWDTERFNGCATVHAVDTAAALWALGGSEGWYASSTWCQALRLEYPILSHFTILRLLESCRTTSSSEIAASSREVAAQLLLLPNPLPVLSVLATTLCSDVSVDQMVGFFAPHSYGALYRALLLRRLLPRGSVHHSLISSNVVLNSFLPEVVALKLEVFAASDDETESSSSSTHPRGRNNNNNVCVRVLSSLVADVYILLSRACVDEGDVSGCCRWLTLSLTECKDAANQEAVQRTLHLLAERVLASGEVGGAAADSLVNIPLSSPELLSMLSAALMQRLQPPASSGAALRPANRQEWEATLYARTAVVYRFHMKQHASSQASRLAYDAAMSIRSHLSNASSANAEVVRATLTRVVQLLSLAESATRAIRDVPSPFVHVVTSNSSTNPAIATLPRSSTISPTAALVDDFSSIGCAGATLYRGGSAATTTASSNSSNANKMTLFSRADLPLIHRKLAEANFELLLHDADYHLDARDARYGEDLTADDAAQFAKRFLRILISMKFWSEAKTYAEITNQSVDFVLQCQGVCLLEDPLYRQMISVVPAARSSQVLSDVPVLSTFEAVKDAWCEFIDDCRNRSLDASSNAAPLCAVLEVLMQKQHDAVPMALKAALLKIRPSLLINLLLNVRVASAQSARIEVSEDAAVKKEVPGSVAGEIFDVVIEYMDNRTKATPLLPSHHLTSACIDRSVELAKTFIASHGRSSQSELVGIKTRAEELLTKAQVKK